MDNQFKYTLYSQQKFDCPSCGAVNRYVRYMDVTTGKYVIDNDFGRCDRENVCGYWKKIEGNVQIKPNEVSNDINLPNHNPFDSDCLPENYYKPFRNNCLGGVKYENTFLRGIAKRFGKRAAIEVYNKYNLGTFYNGGVVFPYSFYGKLNSGKIMWYDENLNRIKEGKKSFPRWLHNFDYKKDNSNDIVCSPFAETYKSIVGLFGYDAIDFNKKTICVVESEKTAIICSILYPQCNWLASGGAGNLHPEKFHFYLKFNWLLFPDMGIALQKWKVQAEKIESKGYNYVRLFDYLPKNLSNEKLNEHNQKGSDIADFLLQNDSSYINFINDKLNIFINDWYIND